MPWNATQVAFHALTTVSTAARRPSALRKNNARNGMSTVERQDVRMLPAAFDNGGYVTQTSLSSRGFAAVLIG